MSKRCSRKGYEIVVDYGKPYSITANGRKELRRELRGLRKEAERHMEEDDAAYFDVQVYDGCGRQLTREEVDKMEGN